MAVLTINRVPVTAPVSIIQNGELIWSSNTGRSTSGIMVGDIIAKKRSNAISWGILTQPELTTIVTNIDAAAFVQVSFNDYKTGTFKSFTVYRDTFSTEDIGLLSDGIYYYRSASVNIIEQ